MIVEKRKIGRPRKFQTKEECARQRAAYVRAWRLKNPEKARAYALKSQKKRREKLREWYNEIMRARNRKYYKIRKLKEPDYAKKRALQERQNNPLRHFWRNKKYRAEKESIEFDLEPSDFLAPDVCPVLGIPMEKFGHSKGYCYPGSASIDRMDPSRGYVKSNIKIISFRANTLKRDCTDPDELRKVADYIERCNKELESVFNDV